MTVTGKTLGENCDKWVTEHGELSMKEQDIIHPLSKPIKRTGHIR
jgi:dihydroxy-acid dehydratase